ncbi:hypothetical protein NQ315_006217 [Exocentrus adspersus]|uniref:Dynein axonemal assembly factor 4 n=1 Tax=Exocentrus adspersus TaxID=1586481 RepID=A0AAV8VZD3_9CUCU|nr:hypothetical protein NQ315_006217 [Exocentrus adspersus]
MPIVIKDYDWKQTKQDLSVHIPLKVLCEQKADIFTSKRYLKVKYEQYFFELILLHSIDVSKSQCKLTDDNVIFELRKEEEQTWHSLEPDIPKKEKLELKKRLLDEAYSRIQEQDKEKINKKAELKRVAVREQIELDTIQRDRIEEVKTEEKTNALGDVNQWSAEIATNTRIDSPKKQHNINSKNKISTHAANKILIKPTIEAILPSPRAVKTLEIEFTPREFPTPSRESQLDEENEWLSKQAEARRSAGFISEDVRPEERNPQFLKAKGDEFLRNKNYLGAISAYSFGIKICPKFVDLHIARSEAHFLVGNFNKAVQDCSSALDLLKPAVSLNLNERALCVGRRGEALCKLGFIKQGVEELKISLQLKPSPYFTTVLETIRNENAV